MILSFYGVEYEGGRIINTEMIQGNVKRIYDTP